MITITYNPKTINSNHISYLIKDPSNNEVVFAGAGKLLDVLTLRKVVKVSTFDLSKNYVVEMHNAFPHLSFAYSDADRLCGHKIPKYNMDFVCNKRNSIVCIETGEIYRNQAEVCSSTGLPQSMVSNHLNRRSGYKSIKGLHFTYTINTEA